MIWDFGEANLVGSAVGAWYTYHNYIADCCDVVLTEISAKQAVKQFNAAKYSFDNQKFVVSTDPPYYDNIGYSDLQNA
jgi:putative DNA methylase